jgi:hypothetical protein
VAVDGDSGTPPTPNDGSRVDSGVELRTGAWGTAISVFGESLICSAEFDVQTWAAVVGLMIGSVCDEVPRPRSRP